MTSADSSSKEFNPGTFDNKADRQLPLEGIKVLDLGRYIAAPYCAMLLADMGAEVIRVERRGGGEDRFLGPVTTQGDGAHFISLNRNKRSLTLDISNPQARCVIERLVAESDILIANLPVKVLNKLRLDYDSLSAINPRLILARISTFGPAGPYCERAGFDGIAQAMSGSMAITGFPEAPVRAIVPFEDFGTALHTTFGIMTALFHRMKSGRGQVVDASLIATGVTFMQPLLGELGLCDTKRSRIGNSGFYSAPMDVYRASDGWIIVQTIGDEMFRRWTRLVEKEDLAQNPRFSTDALRQENRAELNSIMSEWVSRRSVAEAVSMLNAAKLPAGPVLEIEDVVNDCQVQDRNLLPQTEYPGAPAAVRIANTPVILSDTPGSIRRRAPLVGEHTDEILRELAFSAEEISAMRHASVI